MAGRGPNRDFYLRRRIVPFALSGQVSFKPSFEDGDGGLKVVAEGDEQVDVVEIFLAVEAVGEVVAWVDGGEHFAAVWAEEAEVAFAPFGGRPVAAEGGDGDGHGQVVADAAQQVRSIMGSPMAVARSGQ